MLTVTQLYSLTTNSQWPVNLSMLSTDKPATGYGIVASGVAYLYDIGDMIAQPSADGHVYFVW